MSDNQKWSILQGDALKVLGTFAPNTFDAVITDPPYASGGRTQAEKNKSTARKYSSMGENALPPFDGDAKDQRSWTRWAAEWLYEARKVSFFLEKEVTKERTLLYKQKLQDENLAPATINLYVIAVNRYLRYLECEQASIKTLKVQKKNSVENVINRKEYQELLDYAKSSGRKNITISKTGGIKFCAARFM